MLAQTLHIILHIWLVTFLTYTVAYRSDRNYVSLEIINTSRTVLRSIPGGVTGFFSDIFRPYHDPGVDSAPSENEYQEHFLGVKAVGA